MKKIYNIFLNLTLGLIGILFLYSGTLNAALIRTDATGLYIGDGVIKPTSPSENMVYVVSGATATGGLLLLQNGVGNNRLYLDYDGNLTVYGAVKGAEICIGEECRSSWSEVIGSSGWEKSGINVRLDSSGDRVGIGVEGPNAKLEIRPQNNLEGIRVVSSNYSPFVIRNSDDTLDLFRINQAGNVSLIGVLDMGGNRISNIASPISESDAATKAYVDAQVVSAVTVSNKMYYLTKDFYRPDQVANACGAGYSFAAVGELVNYYDMEYDIDMGMTMIDMGGGPPMEAGGWARSGAGTHVGRNCPSGPFDTSPWTGNRSDYSGRVASISFDGNIAIGIQSCSTEQRVWCITGSSSLEPVSPARIISSDVNNIQHGNTVTVQAGKWIIGRSSSDGNPSPNVVWSWVSTSDYQDKLGDDNNWRAYCKGSYTLKVSSTNTYGTDSKSWPISITEGSCLSYSSGYAVSDVCPGATQSQADQWCRERFDCNARARHLGGSSFCNSYDEIVCDWCGEYSN